MQTTVAWRDNYRRHVAHLFDKSGSRWCQNAHFRLHSARGFCENGRLLDTLDSLDKLMLILVEVILSAKSVLQFISPFCLVSFLGMIQNDIFAFNNAITVQLLLSSRCSKVGQGALLWAKRAELMLAVLHYNCTIRLSCLFAILSQIMITIVCQIDKPRLHFPATQLFITDNLLIQADLIINHGSFFCGDSCALFAHFHRRAAFLLVFANCLLFEEKWSLRGLVLDWVLQGTRGVHLENHIVSVLANQ